MFLAALCSKGVEAMTMQSGDFDKVRISQAGDFTCDGVSYLWFDRGVSNDLGKAIKICDEETYFSRTCDDPLHSHFNMAAVW